MPQESVSIKAIIAVNVHNFFNETDLNFYASNVFNINNSLFWGRFFLLVYSPLLQMCRVFLMFYKYNVLFALTRTQGFWENSNYFSPLTKSKFHDQLWKEYLCTDKLLALTLALLIDHSPKPTPVDSSSQLLDFASFQKRMKVFYDRHGVSYSIVHSPFTSHTYFTDSSSFQYFHQCLNVNNSIVGNKT